VTRRYRILLLATVGLGVLLGALSRLPQRATARPETPIAVPLVALSLEIRDGGVAPETCETPKGSRERWRRGSSRWSMNTAWVTGSGPW